MLEKEVHDKFKLDLEHNFAVVLWRYLEQELDKKQIDRDVRELFETLKDNDRFSLIDSEIVFNLIDHKDGELKTRLKSEPLKSGEWISINHNVLDKNRVLQVYFNQYDPNDMYRTAWGYISNNIEHDERHGCMLVERERAEDKDLIEFCFFRQNLLTRNINHYAHVLTEIDESDRERITIGGFVGFRAIMAALAGKQIDISTGAVDNLLQAVVAPIYEFFQHQKSDI